MTVPFISFDEMDPILNWSDITQAIEAGHALPQASLADSFAYRRDDTLLSRSAWIDGLGVAVKAATVLPGNPAKKRPMINGGVMVFDDATGTLEALIDFHLVTKWKTAGDSLLAAQKLAHPDSHNILILGAGTVAQNMISAYASVFADAQFKVWNRTAENAETRAREMENQVAISVTDDLASAVDWADIITGCTMTTEPVIDGVWLRAGQHVNLIGAYRPDMREANDRALKKSRIFVDSRATTLNHIGELKHPLAEGVIVEEDIIADYYDLPSGDFARQTEDEITLFKNGGGAHLDLMVAKVILEKWRRM